MPQRLKVAGNARTTPAGAGFNLCRRRRFGLLATSNCQAAIVCEYLLGVFVVSLNEPPRRKGHEEHEAIQEPSEGIG